MWYFRSCSQVDIKHERPFLCTQNAYYVIEHFAWLLWHINMLNILKKDIYWLWISYDQCYRYWMHVLVTDAPKTKAGGHGSCNHSHVTPPPPLRRVIQVVDCSLCNVCSLLFNLWICFILPEIGTSCHTCRSRASQTRSVFAEYAGHARIGMFSASRNYVQVLATWGHALSCCNMREWWWMKSTTTGLRIMSWHLYAFKLPSIKCTCVCSL